MTISNVRDTGKIVRTIENEKVVFDPYNAEHRQAFRLIMLAGKQTDLRFELENFETVPAMMLYKMAVFGAGAIDQVCINSRMSLAERAHIHAIPLSNKVLKFQVPAVRQFK